LNIPPQLNNVTNCTRFCSPRGLGSENTTWILANGLLAVIQLCSLLPMGRFRLYRQLARPSYLYITCCAEEESDDRDGGGKRSCTERGLCTVAQFC